MADNDTTGVWSVGTSEARLAGFTSLCVDYHIES